MKVKAMFTTASQATMTHLVRFKGGRPSARPQLPAIQRLRSHAHHRHDTRVNIPFAVDTSLPNRGSGVGEDTSRHGQKSDGLTKGHRRRIEVDQDTTQVGRNTALLESCGPLRQQEDAEQRHNNRRETPKETDGHRWQVNQAYEHRTLRGRVEQ